MKQGTGDTQAITITIPVADHNALVALAEREERSMAAQVRVAIRMMLYASAETKPNYGYLATPQAQEPPADDPEDDEHPF